MQNILIQISLPYLLRVSFWGKMTKPRGMKNLRFLIDTVKLPSICSTDINLMLQCQARFWALEIPQRIRDKLSVLRSYILTWYQLIFPPAMDENALLLNPSLAWCSFNNQPWRKQKESTLGNLIVKKCSFNYCFNLLFSDKDKCRCSNHLHLCLWTVWSCSFFWY